MEWTAGFWQRSNGTGNTAVDSHRCFLPTSRHLEMALPFFRVAPPPHAIHHTPGAREGNIVETQPTADPCQRPRCPVCTTSAAIRLLRQASCRIAAPSSQSQSEGHAARRKEFSAVHECAACLNQFQEKSGDIPLIPPAVWTPESIRLRRASWKLATSNSSVSAPATRITKWAAATSGSSDKIPYRYTGRITDMGRSRCLGYAADQRINREILPG
ncbi:hypothetical protein VTK26DRAFT_5587 [Humicola hyalothermophila]